jgi:hypothetical protein
MKRSLVFLAVLLAACGSDDESTGFIPALPATIDDDGETKEIAYAYELSAVPDTIPLTLFTTGDDGTIGISVDFGQTMSGDVEFKVIDDRLSRINWLSVVTQSSINVDSDVGNEPFLGAFTIEVTDQLEFWTEVPHFGVYRVISPTETVTLKAIPGGMLSSVEISLDGEPPIPMTWSELADVLDDETAPPWQRRAALTGGLLEFMYDQFFAIAGVFGFIDDELLTVNPATVPCDAFPGTPPPGVLLEGIGMLAWLGPGSIPSVGDDFDLAFIDCWFDDSGSGHDLLFEGNLLLTGYGGPIDDGHQMMGRGFDEVLYDDLVIRQTIEKLDRQFTIDASDTIEVVGSFRLAIDEIDN